MPEYYDDIDTNRLGLLSILAANLEFFSKLIQFQQMSTKKEFCQEMYNKTYMSAQNEIDQKKEYNAMMFAQTNQGIPPDYQKILMPMPLGDSSVIPMPAFQRMPQNNGHMDLTHHINNGCLPTMTPGYRVDMRDACTSTSSPHHEQDCMEDTKPEEEELKTISAACSSGFKAENDADFNMSVSVPSHNVFKKQNSSMGQNCQQQFSVHVPHENIKPEEISSMTPHSTPHTCDPSQFSAGNGENVRPDHERGDCGIIDVVGLGATEMKNSPKNTSHRTKTSVPRKPQIFKCSQCTEFFKTRRALIRHTRSHPAEKSYPCFDCGKMFSRNSALINHKRTHSKDKAYSCEQCGVSMPTRNDLSTHELTHVGVRPFVCQDCGKSFKKAGALSTHRKLHTGDTPFVCDFCGKAFTSNGNLENHVRVHSGDKPYLCEYCGKAFNTTANLNRHVRIHTGEKPYVCDWCTKAFSQSYALVIHKRIHTGEQPYFCKQCGKTFSDNSTLYKHKRIHKDPVGEGSTSSLVTNKFNRKGVVQLPVLPTLNPMNPHSTALSVAVTQSSMANVSSVSPGMLPIPPFVSTAPMVGSALMSVAPMPPVTNATAAIAAVTAAAASMSPGIPQGLVDQNDVMRNALTMASTGTQYCEEMIPCPDVAADSYPSTSVMNAINAASILTNGASTRLPSNPTCQALNADPPSMTVQ